MKIRLLFDYGCNFIWLYIDDCFEPVRVSSEGCFTQNFYSSEIINGKIIRKPNGKVWKYPEKRLIGQTELEEKANFIDEQFLRLWINNEHEFSYKGFDSKEDEQRFDDAVRYVYKSFASCWEMSMGSLMIQGWIEYYCLFHIFLNRNENNMNSF